MSKSVDDRYDKDVLMFELQCLAFPALAGMQLSKNLLMLCNRSPKSYGVSCEYWPNCRLLRKGG